MLKILFMGTPDISKESLEKIYNAGYEICGVVTIPDQYGGRGMKLISSPVKQFAIDNNLKLFQPEKIANNKEFKDEIRELKPDIICVVSYGKILPKSFIEIPEKGCINLHPSLLPKYRGPAPMQWAILNGDKKTGATIMYINEKMDEGDIILQKEVDINDDETTGELWARLSTLGAELMIQALEKIENGTVARKKQGDNYSLAPMLNKEMSKIDWVNKNSTEIKNLVRGLNPIMGAYSYLNNKKIKFWRVEILSLDGYESKDVGTVLLSDEKKGLYIKAKDNIISVLEIQGENAKKMSIKDFLRGNKISVNEKFI